MVSTFWVFQLRVFGRSLTNQLTFSWESKGAPPPENKVLLGDCSGTTMVNNPLIKPYFLGGGSGGCP